MRTAGIIGGVGPESTIDYYRRLISAYSERDPEGNYPHLLINSVNLKVVVDCVEDNRIDDLAGYLLVEVQKLADAGADFAVLSSNTTHIAFDRLQKVSPLPMISIPMVWQTAVAWSVNTSCLTSPAGCPGFSMKRLKTIRASLAGNY